MYSKIKCGWQIITTPTILITIANKATGRTFSLSTILVAIVAETGYIDATAIQEAVQIWHGSRR
jgi:hypothetical protein